MNGPDQPATGPTGHRLRVAVVTGGGRGIGRALALRLGRDGFAVAVSSRTPADLNAVVREIEGCGGSALAVAADARDREGAREPVRAAVGRFGRADVIVNNVGGAAGGDHDPFTGTDEAFENTVALSLTSAYWTTREALPHMRDRGWGRVINIGSGAARSSTPGGRLGYTAAKHGLAGDEGAGITGQVIGVDGGYGI